MLIKAFRMLLLCVALLSFLMLATPSAYAATTTAPSRSVTAGANTMCRTLEVHLHGTQPATAHCLDSQTTTPIGGVTPQIYRPTSCSSDAELDLYWDANWTGAHLCFIGSGVANMNNYTTCTSTTCYFWDNEVSSYITGCSPVTFYVGYNADNSYSHITEPAWHAGNFTPGAVPNDSLSSVYISSGCTA